MSSTSRRPSWLSWYENQVSTTRPTASATGSTATAAVTAVLDAELSRLGLDRSPAERTAALDAEAADVRRRALDRLSAAAARQFPSRPPLAWSAIARLPDVPFAPHLATLDCSVCTSAFQEGQALIHMPCSELHVFHRDCISVWLAIRSSCPLCRSLEIQIHRPISRPLLRPYMPHSCDGALRFSTRTLIARWRSCNRGRIDMSSLVYECKYGARSRARAPSPVLGLSGRVGWSGGAGPRRGRVACSGARCRSPSLSDQM
jgi:hypothetical protein